MKRYLLAVAAAAMMLVPAGVAQAFVSNYFQSPTGNIRCRYNPNLDNIACQTLNDHVVATVPLHGRAWATTLRGTIRRGPTLAYGGVYTVRGRFRCNSSRNGMTCRSIRTGRGFFINRTTYRSF